MAARLGPSIWRGVLGATTLTGASALLLGTPAGAAHPKAGAAYHGTGLDYLNNAPTWTLEGIPRQPINVDVTASGNKISVLKVSYFFYCGSGTDTVTYRHLHISEAGTFHYHFKTPNKVNGQVMGEDYLAVSGHFVNKGHVKVSNLFDYVSPSQHVAHPYDTANPTALGCASWVKGTARAS